MVIFLLQGYVFLPVSARKWVFGVLFLWFMPQEIIVVYKKTKSLITALSFNLDQIDNLLILIKKFRNIKSYFYEGAVPRAAINPSFLKRMTIVEVVRGHLFCLLLP